MTKLSQAKCDSGSFNHLIIPKKYFLISISSVANPNYVCYLLEPLCLGMEPTNESSNTQQQVERGNIEILLNKSIY